MFYVIYFILCFSRLMTNNLMRGGGKLSKNAFGVTPVCRVILGNNRKQFFSIVVLVIYARGEGRLIGEQELL